MGNQGVAMTEQVAEPGRVHQSNDHAGIGQGDEAAMLAAMKRSLAVIEFDLSGNILSANDNFLALMDYEAADLRGKHHSMFVLQEDAASNAYRQFWKDLAGGEFRNGEFLRLGRDGRRVWIQASYSPVLDGNGRPFKVVKFASDVTAAKLAAIENAVRMQTVSRSNGVIEYDATGRIVDINDLMLDALGYTAAEVLGQEDQMLLFDEDRRTDAYLARWRALRQGQAVAGECRRRGAGDRELWFDVTINPVMGLDGQMAKAFMIARDVTRAKLDQLDAAGKLGAIHRAQAVIEFSLDGRVLAANDNFLDLMGYRLADIRGKHHRTFVAEDEAGSPGYVAFWEKLARGDYCSGEFRRVARDGREVWIQATYNPVFDPHGRPLKVVKFATDVTAVKLRNAEFEARSVAMDRSQAVIEFDLDGHILHANRNFLAAMGYTLREVQGQHHSMFCDDEYRQSAEYRDFWLRLGEGQFVSGRFRRKGKYERDVFIQATYNPIFDPNGKVMKVVKYAYDVTKEVELEQRVAAKSGQMMRSVQSLVDSISGIASSSGNASATASQSASAAEAGHQAVVRSMRAMDGIQDSSNKVSDIVRVIGDIANQTNLLAFNAAIEAARAGPHGVGFSVVAAEVRKLAERSSEAAKEIAVLIESSAQQVREGAEVSKSAADSFEGIMGSVQATAFSAMEIAEATEAQRQLADEVSALIETLAADVRR